MSQFRGCITRAHFVRHLHDVQLGEPMALSRYLIAIVPALATLLLGHPWASMHNAKQAYDVSSVMLDGRLQLLSALHAL